MRKIIRFYENEQPANGRIFYMRDDILHKWDDKRLQVRQNYIEWLFPLETDKELVRMNKGNLFKFQRDPELRLQVIKFVTRMMLFFGFAIKIFDEFQVVQVKEVYRQEDGVVIGLYNPENYPRITRILKFLNLINMPILSALFFEMICQAIKKDPELKHLIDTNGVIREWILTQSYLEHQAYDVEEIMIGKEIESWEKEEEVVENKLVDAWD